MFLNKLRGNGGNVEVSKGGETTAPTFTVPDAATIMQHASDIFNPFAPILALVIGLGLGITLLFAVRRMF